MASPTARTLERLRKEGYTCQVVEKWQAFSKRRIDLFGVIDIVGILPGKVGVLGIQATSRGNVNARIAKSLAEPKLLTWLQAKNEFEVWGWGKLKAGWTLNVVQFTLQGTQIIAEKIKALDNSTKVE